MRCDNCGSENRDDAKFCRKCGAPLIKRKRKSGISKVLSCLLVISALASIAAVGYFIVHIANPPTNDDVGNSSTQLAVANLRDYNIKVEDEESAREAIESLGSELAIGNSSHQLGSCRIDGAYGWTYYRFKQEVDGYEVQGRTLTLGVNEHGIAESLASNAISLDEGEREAMVSRADAEGAITSIVGGECDVNVAELVIYPTGDNRGILCYRSYVSTPYGAKLVFVSADDGSLVGQQALSFTEQVEGRGKTKASPSTEVSFMTEHDGATYSLFDKERAITVFDAKGKNVNATPAYADQSGKQYKYDGESEKLVALDDGSTRDYSDDCEYIGLYLSTRGVIGRLVVATSGSTYWSDKTAVSAMHNVSVAHDFYASILGRNGFSGATPHNMSVCINTFSQTNSQWGRTGEDAVIRFSFDDSMQLDTAAHEFTHDVEQSISAMDYEGESGALMEATSDVFAELAEDFADDGQMNNTCDWKQSDCRDLGNPEKSPIAERESGKNKNAHATRYQKEDMYWASTTPEYDKNGDTTNDYGHVHNNSTVISHAAYLMCNGGIDGEGLTTRELADVLYATFFTIPSDCDFAQYAGWVQCKARSMLTPSKVKRVEAAFKAVGISPWLIAYVEPIIDDVQDEQHTTDEAYAAYASKLEEYLDEFGQPDVRAVWNVDEYMCSAEGVCVAELIDFDADGDDELLVVYYDKDVAADAYYTDIDGNEREYEMNDGTAYVAEVWSYADDNLTLAYRQPAQASNGGWAYLSRLAFDDRKSWLESEDYEGSHYIKLWEFVGHDSSVVHYYEIRDEYTSDITTWIDGAEDSRGIDEWRNDYGAERVTYRLINKESATDDHEGINDDGSSYHNVYGCIDLTKETMHRLGITMNEGKGNNESGETDDGTYILSGTVHVHQEDFGGQRTDGVVSIVLDEAVPYEYVYKGTVQAEAHDVLLATTGSEAFGADRYDEWAQYDGRHITVECDGLQGAHHDASYWNVDTLATGKISLLNSSS